MHVPRSVGREISLRPGSKPLAGLDRLTTSEMVVAAYVQQGLTNKEIAELLKRSAATIKSHVGAILRKCELPNRSRFIAAFNPAAIISPQGAQENDPNPAARPGATVTGGGIYVDRTRPAGPATTQRFEPPP